MVIHVGIKQITNPTQSKLSENFTKLEASDDKHNTNTTKVTCKEYKTTTSF